ncbi:MAG: ROK family protein [Kiritimatiellaceae bacterium]|nr:ROK family protein [Kiritimatiellaceae bacterium]
MRNGLIEKKLFIIDYIRRFSPVPRHIISQRFNMNPATVGNIMERLINDGLVMETPLTPLEERRTAGRPPVGLKINPLAGYFIGIDIYDRRLTALLTDFECTPVCEYQATFKQGASVDTILKTLEQSVRALLKISGKPKIKLKGIGLGLPGRINLTDGIAVEYSRIPNWKNIAVGPFLQKAFNTPVFIEHNSNTTALATAWLSYPHISGVVATVLVRTGVSLGIVQDRQIINSGRYSAGELGHTVINFNGPTCRCGNKGCLENYVSGAALSRIVLETAEKYPDWSASKVLKKNTIDADLIWELAAAGDQRSHDILETMFGHLCIGVDTVLKLYAPDVITINGIFHKAAPLLLSAIDRLCSHPLRKQTRICIEPYDLKNSALGAAILAATYTCNPVHNLPGRHAV